MAAICDLTMLETVREQIARGQITGITFWPTGDRWQASARRPGGAYSVAIHEDPFHALLEAVSPSVKRQKVEPKTPADDVFGDLL